MKISVDIRTLQAGIGTAIKSLSSKPSLPILEGIYLAANNNGVLLRCSDLSLQIDCIIPATVEEEGEIVLPGRLFHEYTRKLPGDTVDITVEGRSAFIKAGRTRTSLQCSDARDFPDMAMNGDTCTVSIPQNVCKNMIRQTVFSTAQEESKPILTGVLCEMKDNQLTMVALDGFRLALKRYNCVMSPTQSEAVIPAKSFNEISRTLLDTDDIIKMEFSRTHLLIDMGHTRILSRLLDGDFIKYRGILPTNHTTRVRVNRPALQESLNRAILLAREGSNNLVRFQIGQEILQITANSPMGKLEEELNIHLNGEPLEIAFNAKYFEDVLKAIDDEEIFLDMNNSVSPCVVRPVQGDDFYYLILPVRIFN